MDFKAGIYNKIEQFINASTDQAIQDLYYKINDMLHERDDEKVYQEVINFFFSNNSYYYNPTTNMYVEYIEQFRFITENEMIHIVLQFLTKYHNNAIDFSLKQRIKNKIIKKIKEKHIYQNIPESKTLQDILNFLHPNFFTHKNYAKYFMITLGDIIMKKTDLLYFIPLHIKPSSLIKKPSPLSILSNSCLIFFVEISNELIILIIYNMLYIFNINKCLL